ncbi:MAG: hypothetical protein WC055_14885 [Melioribacteraceae bacterium]
MCRLLLVKSKEQFNPSDYLKPFAKSCKESREFQGHGWGASFYIENNWQHYKNINPIWKDDFSNIPLTNYLMVHARSAFKDLGIVIENNMPFYDERYIFIFNGELQGVKIKEEGRIGAEKIFNFIKRFSSSSMAEGLEKGVEIIKKRTSYLRAVNIIIAEKDAAYVSSNFSEDPDYFTLNIYQSDDLTIVSSERFDSGLNWQPVKNNRLEELKW